MFDAVRAVMREPLSHFLVAGAGLFLLFNYAASPDGASDEEIVVSSGQIEHSRCSSICNGRGTVK